MKKILKPKLLAIAYAMILLAPGAFAQEHKWAGRTLDELEWAIHDRLAALPFHGVFDTLRFEAHDGTVTLTGQVVKESIRHNAERAVSRIAGVDKVVNRVEVLPSSRQDDALRMNVYRAIYEKAPLDRYGARDLPPIHIIVKNGAVSLEGVVDSDADRTLAYTRALQVTAHLSENLRVAPQQAGESR